jgi:hypothetical protein
MPNVYFFYKKGNFLFSQDSTLVRQAVQVIGKPGPEKGDRVKAKVVVTRSAPFFYVTMAIKHPQNHAGQVKFCTVYFNGCHLKKLADLVLETPL